MSEAYHEAADWLQTKLERGVPCDSRSRDMGRIRRALTLEQARSLQAGPFPRSETKMEEVWLRDAQHTTGRTEDGQPATERPEEHPRWQIQGRRSDLFNKLSGGSWGAGMWTPMEVTLRLVLD